MTGFLYQLLPEADETEEEKSPSTSVSATSVRDRHERFQKTVFALCVFAIVWGGIIGLLTLLDRGENRQELWNIRQSLIPQSES